MNPDPSRPTHYSGQTPLRRFTPFKIAGFKPLGIGTSQKNESDFSISRLGSMVIGMGIICLEWELPKLLKDKQNHLGQTQVKLNGIVFRCKSAKDRLFLQQQLEIRQKSYWLSSSEGGDFLALSQLPQRVIQLPISGVKQCKRMVFWGNLLKNTVVHRLWLGKKVKLCLRDLDLDTPNVDFKFVPIWVFPKIWVSPLFSETPISI